MIQLKNIHKSFGKFNVLKGIDLSVIKGDVVAILGPSGSGKTTLLNLLAGIPAVICGIIAWVMGSADLKEMDAGRMDPSGRGSTNAGKICGMISVILACVGTVIYILAMAVVIARLAH